jgi:hypothetical protein
VAVYRSSSENIGKMNLKPVLNETSPRGSYGVGYAWCSWKACEIYSSLVQKKNEKKLFSSYMLPKQQSTSFWFQGILGIKKDVFTSIY